MGLGVKYWVWSDIMGLGIKGVIGSLVEHLVDSVLGPLQVIGSLFLNPLLNRIEIVEAA